MGKNLQIAALNNVGQSIWYDNCSRDVLQSGELEKLIEQGVSGLTSNPTIFKKAIADSNNYDEDIARLSRAGGSAEDICETLMVQDVAAAADLLRPVFDATGGGDGHASIEVSPLLAADTAGTIAAAERLWKKLNRPNGMIKIPATPEGLPAIAKVIEQGINVNVTLIFSGEVYREVVDAYLTGLEARVQAGQPMESIASVASFFVSRVDAIVEKFLAKLVESGKITLEQQAESLGKVGVANSRLAYTAFGELFSGERFEKLREQGAQSQRPLWASTGTKNPDFSAVLYVEELAGSQTVNTVPPATLAALMEKATIESRLQLAGSDAVLAGISKLEVPFDELLLELRDAGVKSFADSYDQLIAAIREKQKKLAA